MGLQARYLLGYGACWKLLNQTISLSLFEEHCVPLCSGHGVSPGDKVYAATAMRRTRWQSRTANRWAPRRRLHRSWRAGVIPSGAGAIPSGERLGRLSEQMNTEPRVHWIERGNSIHDQRNSRSEGDEGARPLCCCVRRTHPLLRVFWLLSFSSIQHVLAQCWVSLTALPPAYKPSPAQLCYLASSGPFL